MKPGGKKELKNWFGRESLDPNTIFKYQASPHSVQFADGTSWTDDGSAKCVWRTNRGKTLLRADMIDGSPNLLMIFNLRQLALGFRGQRHAHRAVLRWRRFLVRGDQLSCIVPRMVLPIGASGRPGRR